MRNQRQNLSLFVIVTYIELSLLIPKSASIYADDIVSSSRALKVPDFPLLNKCCPFDQKWGNGGCIPSNVKSNFQYTVIKLMKKNIKILSMNESSTTEEPVTAVAYKYMDSNETLENSTETDYTESSDTEEPIGNNAPIVFRLQVSMPKCSSARKLVKKIIHKEVYSRSNGSQTNHIGGLNFEPSLPLTSEGLLSWNDENGFINTYSHENFCIDQINDTSFIALFCNPRCDDMEPCIRKCCKKNEVLDIGIGACIASQEPWSPFLYDSLYSPTKVNGTPHYIAGLPNNCETYIFTPSENDEDKMYILTNGSLVTLNRGTKVIYPANTFCVDGLVDMASQPVYHSGSELDQIALICFPPKVEEESDEPWRYKLYANLELISSAFLVLTSLVYLILWEYQNIHGWLQFAYVGSCFFAFTFLAIVQLYTVEINDYSKDLCESMGTLIHFWFLSAFFWLTSMNFDLWWTFSGCHPLRPSSKTGDKKRFCIFAIFSWGFPGFIAGLGMILDYMYKDHPESGIITPKFGDPKCYFRGHKEQLPYLYGPVGFLLFVDLLLFLHTVYSLQKLHKDTKFATRQSSKQDNQKFVLFMKIFIVMGVLWIFEVISWSFEVYSSNEVTKTIFIPFDIINALQGLWIFIIFACKPNTCRQLENKFKKLTAFMEHHRDEERESTSVLSQVIACFKITCCTLTLPFVHLLRKTFSTCGRTNRSLDSRRATSNTTTVTINTLDKSRKFSDCSTTTTYSTSEPGSFEMDSTIKIISLSNPL